MSVKNVRFVWNDDLHALVRRAAFDRGVTMAAFVEDAVRSALEPPPSSVKTREDPGLSERLHAPPQPRPVRDFSKTQQVKAKK